MNTDFLILVSQLKMIWIRATNIYLSIIFTRSPSALGGVVAYWCDLVEESGIQPFKQAAKTLLAHWSGIVNYAESRLNNGILEGINSKIQLAKKRARGYRNINNFINMIYFIAGTLKFDYPL
jgi:hypothetical protein